MMERFRAFWGQVFTPVARLLLRLGVSPDVVTIIGTVGVCAAALVFFPRGDFLVGVLVIVVFVFSDLVDGLMARLSGQSSSWGAFLDSTLDRFGDAAIFAGIAMYYAGRGDSQPLTGLAIYCLVMGSVTSYVRARAESLGMQAKVGIAERADRLVAVLLMTGLSDLLDVPALIPVMLGALAVASTVTVLQRVLLVRSQARATV
ncbi:MAG TPA: CDP-alcohol phosphatidyltransferase family protein [Nocardioidaceae bacterium]|jgi:CDP-diacylglycerol--glycerol-3-phosphate 3-phosphatidyltransferase/CDP-diacylglycerol--inositol 3-phosphatidyltransferase|nr:CDP-alcohol phosphatidyltransferase family protein [Nocardioidaceae bacterium]